MKSSKTQSFLSLVALLLCFSTAGLFASEDWVNLKDGSQVHGKILRQTEKEVTLKSKNGGVFTFKLNQVVGIHYSEATKANSKHLASFKKDKLEISGSKGLRYEPANEHELVGLKLLLPKSFSQAPATQSGLRSNQLILFLEKKNNLELEIQLWDKANSPQGLDLWCRLNSKELVSKGAQKLHWRNRLLSGKKAVFSAWKMLGAKTSAQDCRLKYWLRNEAGHYVQITFRMSLDEYRKQPERYEAILSAFSLLKSK